MNNLTIDAGATLNNQTFQTRIYGDYTVNGTHSGSGDINLRMYGSEAVIDGTGNITHTGYFYMGTGNKSIAATADLTFADGLRINNNLIITNYGHVRFGYRCLRGCCRIHLGQCREFNPGGWRPAVFKWF